jgi:uncharacterized membrane protein YfcA
MSSQTIIMLVLTGLAAGILSGVIGVEGGIIIVPALVLLFGFNEKEAQGTSLAILLLLIGIVSIFEYYQRGRIKISYAVIVAFAFLIGTYIGSKYAYSFNEQKLKRVFAVTMMLLSIRMLFFEKQKNAPPPSTVSSQNATSAQLKKF